MPGALTRGVSTVPHTRSQQCAAPLGPGRLHPRHPVPCTAVPPPRPRLQTMRHAVLLLFTAAVLLLPLVSALDACPDLPSPHGTRGLRPDSDPRLRTAFGAVDALFGRMARAQRLPGLTAAVVLGGDVVWHKGYGRANASAPGSAPPGPRDLLRVASITKVFTALLLFRLEELGVVGLDDPLTKWMPGFRINARAADRPAVGAQAPVGQSASGRSRGSATLESGGAFRGCEGGGCAGGAEAEPERVRPGADAAQSSPVVDASGTVTLRDLASHTSGLPREVPYPCSFSRTCTEQQVLAALAPHFLVFPPKTRFHYSNLGFALLGRALAHAANRNLDTLGGAGPRTYEEWLQELVLRPLGMNASFAPKDPEVHPPDLQSLDVPVRGRSRPH